MPRLIRLFAANRLAGYAVAYAASAALQKGIGFVIFMWLAHSLSVQSYASFGLLYALQAGLATFAIAGVVEAVVGLMRGQQPSSTRDALFSSANRVFAGLSLVCVAIVVLVGEFLTRWSEVAWQDLAVVTVAGILTAFFTLQSQLTRLEENHFASLALSAVPPLAALLGGAAAFALTGVVSGFFSGFALGLVSALAPMWFYGIGNFRFARDGGGTSAIRTRLSPFILIAFLTWLSGYGITYLVGAFFTSVEVAKFTFVYTLSSVLQLVATSLNQVWSPRVFKLLHEVSVETVEAKNRRFYALQGATLGFVGVAVSAVVPLVIAAGGAGFEHYSGLTGELFFLFAAYGLSIPWYHAQNYFYAFSKGAELMHISLLTTFAGLLLLVGLMSLLGSIGAYVGLMAMAGLRTVGVVIWARREWSISILWQGPLIAIGILAAAAVLARTLTSLVS